MFKDGRYWPFLIVALLSVSVIANVFLIIKATTDPSFAVERDYYAKAVTWDEHQQEQADSNALGWHAALKAERDRLELRLLDADGRPIVDEPVHVRLPSGEVREAQLDGRDPPTPGPVDRLLSWLAFRNIRIFLGLQNCRSALTGAAR